MINDALDLWKSLKGKVAQLFRDLSVKSLQCERYDVTTPPNGSVIGVTQPFSETEIFIPYSWECAKAKVGDTVLVVWWNTLSTARAWFLGGGPSMTIDGGGGEISADDITSGTLAADRLPVVPIAKGGTGASTAAGARVALGITYGTANPSETPATGEGALYFKII